MVYFTVPVVCVLVCLIQTGLGQSCGCNQYSYGPGLISGYGSPSLSGPSYSASYGGTGTGQVGVTGDIGASGQTAVVGAVPVLGSVGFSGRSPAYGSVSICGHCGCVYPDIRQSSYGENSLSQPSLSVSAPSYAASYGRTGTGQLGVSGDNDASGQKVVIGAVPVLGSVDFDGWSPVSGTVSISGQCGCECD